MHHLWSGQAFDYSTYGITDPKPPGPNKPANGVRRPNGEGSLLCDSLLVYETREGHRKDCKPFSSSCRPPPTPVLARWPGKQGLGRDAGLLMKLNWEPGVRRQKQQGPAAPGVRG